MYLFFTSLLKMTLRRNILLILELDPRSSQLSFIFFFFCCNYIYSNCNYTLMFLSLIDCTQSFASSLTINTGSPTVCIISQTVTFLPILLTGFCSKIFKNIQFKDSTSTLFQPYNFRSYVENSSAIAPFPFLNH